MTITSDNIPLSGPISWPPSVAVDSSPDRAIDCNPSGSDSCAINCTDPLVRSFLAASKAANTHRAYESDLRHFLSWGGFIPADDRTIARYLAEHAETLKTSTLSRRLVAIRSAHADCGLVDPTRSELVRLTMKGIQRKCGMPRRQVRALMVEHLVKMWDMEPRCLADIRDRSLLLLGFAGAFRRSELVSIDVEHLRFRTDGIRIRIPKSKTDQERAGRTVFVPKLSSAICPHVALESWLSQSGIHTGSLFRSLRKAKQVSSHRLSNHAVARIVKRHVTRIGLDAADYAGHSLRAGFVTTAAMAGMGSWQIRQQTGHSSDNALSHYIRKGADW
jgi:integrase